MTDNADFITAYAKVKSELRDARKAVLSANGFTEESLRELEERAMAQMGEDKEITTEFGTVQRYSVPVYLRKSGKEIDRRTKIHFTQHHIKPKE